MASIDERIVEMKFRRDDFLKGTDETLSALQRLETSLSGAGGIGAGVAKIGSKFSLLGAIGTGALLKIGGAAVEAGSRLLKGVMEPIFGGGKRRAINLEQADFMLNNIYKDAGKVEAVMEDVSYAVDGTAFGLDAAAIAAAQFAASGYESGDVMKTALRGISGVASMTASTYEDISSVFTKVAGQGRLMGDDLNRLSARGINAAATMVDYYKSIGKFGDITEVELRKMVSKGEVSFEDFAAAMDGAFGADATKANEIYTGSLANIKAALARIGADYFTIEHEKMRRVFNALRPAITAFQKALGPLWETYERLYAIPMAEKFERWGAALLKIDWGPMVSMMSQFLVIGSTFKDVIASWVKPISDAFAAVFMKGTSGGWMESIGNFLDSFNRGLGSLSATEGQQAGVIGFFTGIFNAVDKLASFMMSAFRAVGPVLTWLWDIFKVGIDYIVQGFEWLSPIVTDFFSSLFGQEGSIRSFFQGFMTSIEETGSVFETLGIYMSAFYDNHILPFIESLGRLKDAFLSIKDDGLEGFRDKLGNAFEPLSYIGDWIKALWTGLTNMFSDVRSPLQWLKDQIPKIGQVFNDFFGGIKRTIGNMNIDFSGIFEGLGGALGGAAKAIAGLFEGVTIDDIIKLVGALSKLVVVFLAFRTIKSLKGMFDSISGFFWQAAESIKNFGKETVADKLLKIAIALGLLVAALWVLSKIDTGDLVGGIAILAALSLVLIGLSWALDKFDSGNISLTAFGLILLVGALAGLAVVLTLLGMLPFDVLAQGLSTVAIALLLLVGAGILLGQFGTDLHLAGLGLLMIAGALTLLVIPILILGKMDLATLAQGLGGVAIALAALVGAALLLGKGGPQMLIGAAALLLIAAALTLMVIPIRQMSEMDMLGMVKALVILTLALVAMVAAAATMQGLGKGALGILAIAAALVILAFGIDKLSRVDFASGAKGLGLLAIALGILVGASALASLILPGVLGLAALVLAFGVASLLAGVGTKLFAEGTTILADALPALVDGLLLLAEAMPDIINAAPKMIIMGAALGAFAIGAGLAGIAGMGLGIALFFLGNGLELMARFGPPGTDALLAFTDAIKPLMWEAPRITIVATALGALGAAMLVLGGGMVIAGIGLTAFGVGAVLAAVGVGVFVLAAFGASKLVDGIADSFGKLGPLAGGISKFATRVGVAAVSLTNFKTAAEKTTAALDPLIQKLMLAQMVFPIAASAIENAATRICTALSQIVACLTVANMAIQIAATQLKKSFENVTKGITASAGPSVAAATGMMKGIVLSLNAGNMGVKASTTKIVKSFTDMSPKLAMAGAKSILAVSKSMLGIVTALSRGAGQVSTAVSSVVRAFEGLPRGISQNGSRTVGAVRTMVSMVSGALRGSAGTIRAAAYSAGTSAGSGMAAGIQASAGRAASAAASMGARAIASAKRAIAAASPSKKFMELGNWSVDGFLMPFQKRVGEAEAVSEDMANASLDAFDEIVSQLEGEFDGLSDFRPTITPVLDLNGVRRQAGGIGGMLGSDFNTDYSRNTASSLAVLEDTLRDMVQDKPEKEKPKMEFTQINQSPKALDASEIYRQSKNLISEMERRDR